MKVKINCEYGKYVEGMRIHCTKTDSACSYQVFRPCRGWWGLNSNYKQCKERRKT